MPHKAIFSLAGSGVSMSGLFSGSVVGLCGLESPLRNSIILAANQAWSIVLVTITDQFHAALLEFASVYTARISIHREKVMLPEAKQLM